MSSNLTVRPTTSSSTLIVQQGATGPLVLQPRRRRDAVAAQLLSPWLDGRIASGVAPETGRLLAARAAHLVDHRTRRSLAEAWEHLLERAAGSRGVIDARVPVARDVHAATAEILELAAALRSTTPVAARDVARARTLLTDGTGPVYDAGQGLKPVVAELVERLSGSSS